MDTSSTPSFPGPAVKSGNFFKNRKTILSLVLIGLVLGYGAWAASGFSLDIFRFFAAENDVDRDGYVTSLDCDDADPNVNSAATDVCGDGIDQDCSGADRVCATTTPSTNTPDSPSDDTVPVPAPNSDLSECDKTNFVHSITIHNSGEATARARNNNGVPCEVSLASYEIWSDRGGTPPHYIQQQTLFDHQMLTINSGQTKDFSITLPECYAQIDLVIGEAIEPPTYHPSVFLGVRFQNVSDPDGTQHYCNEEDQTPTPTPSPTTAICPATAPTGALATKVSGTSATLTWTPGTGGTYQQLRVGANQAEVNSGCQAVPTTCVVVEHNLPASTAMYFINNKLKPGTTYYWRVVNLQQGPPVCYKDVAAQFTTPAQPSTPPTTCPITAPSNLASTVTGTSAVLTWTPGSSAGEDVGDYQQLRVGANQAEVNSGCQAIPTTCIAVEHKLPLTTNSYTVTGLTPGVKYYWRVVNFRSQTCYKDAAATFTPATQTSPVVCSPKNQNRNPGEVGIVSASGGTGVYSWSAPGGTPATGTGSTFGTAFTAAGSHDVTVTMASADSNSPNATAVCKIFVVTPPVGFQCSPSTQTAFLDQTVSFTAVGGSGTYTWSAPDAVVTTGSGQGFSTRYKVTGTRTVTVTSGTENRTCEVVIQAEPTPTTTTPPSTPSLTLSKLVRNTTTNSAEVDVVSASPGDTVEFTIRVTANNATARNVRLTDVLPAGTSYITGSTVVDGATVGDGLVSAGGISLGDIVAGQTRTIRFRAQIASEGTFSNGTTTLTNTATATADNLPPVSDPAFVNVTRNPANPVYKLEKYGRNVTRGEFAEQSRVTAYANNTIEFLIHVTNAGSTLQSNVIVRDVLPSYITYIAKTTSIDGILAGDGLTSGGLNIGSLNPGQEKIVRFSGKVASASSLPVGTTSVINTAQLDQPLLIAQLPIVIINGIVAGAGTVPTGAEDSVLAALLVSLLITLMYVAYTRTQLFKTRELKTLIKKHRGNEDDFDFKK